MLGVVGRCHTQTLTLQSRRTDTSLTHVAVLANTRWTVVLVLQDFVSAVALFSRWWLAN